MPTPAIVPRRPWTVSAAQAEQEEAARSGAGNDRDSQRQRQQQIAAAQSEALKYCRLALDLRTAAAGSARPSAEEYDAVRYYLAYLHYASGELDEAAALGEALAQASSDSPAARQAARIGLAAREALLRRATRHRGRRRWSRLQALAEKIIQRWGDRAEADDARGILLDLALDEGRLEKAEQYLQEISAASPRRGEAELNLGQALWQRARQLLRSSTLEHDHTAEAEKTIARAAGLLGDGIARCRKAIDSGAGPQGPRAGSCYGHAPRGHARPGPDPHDRGPTCRGPCLAGRPEHRRRGFPLPGPAGLCRNRPVGQGQGLLADTSSVASACRRCQCRAANASDLPAHPSSLEAPPRGLSRSAAGRFGEENRAAVRCFPGLARRGAGSRQFLRPGLAGGSLLPVWPSGLDVGGPAVLPEAEKQYRQAVAAFQEILHRAATEAEFSPAAEVTIALRIELARCLRRLSDNPQALSQLLAVLKDHPLMVDAQVEAAYTYQSWGDEKPEYLEMAIQGGKRYQEVWGWGELARRVQSEARFRDVFHEARYNLALCRLRQAQIATDRPQRARLAEAAEERYPCHAAIVSRHGRRRLV